MKPLRSHFVDFGGWMEASLDFGLSLDEAIKELLDNAIDAGATVIDLRLHSLRNNGGLLIQLQDNGCGIPKSITDVDGYTREGLGYVLSFGGRHDGAAAGGDRIGRFGAGLPSATARLAGRDGNLMLWSRSTPEGDWWTVEWSYANILADKCRLPPQRPGHPELMAGVEGTGTVIKIMAVDAEAKRLRVESLAGRLRKDAALTYRHAMADGVSITITKCSTPEMLPGKDGLDAVELQDPLGRFEESLEVKRFGGYHQYESEVLVLDGTGEAAGLPVMLGDDGAALTVTVRAARANDFNVDEYLAQQAHAQADQGKRMDAKARTRSLASWGFGAKTGFDIVRANRVIHAAFSRGLFTRHSSLNYFHGEIAFPPDKVLDSYFGIQANKSRFGIDEELREALKGPINRLLEQVRRDQRAAGEERKALNKARPSTQAVEAELRTVAHRLPTPVYTFEQREAGAAWRLAHAERLKKAVGDSPASVWPNLASRLPPDVRDGPSGALVSYEVGQELDRIDEHLQSPAPVIFEASALEDCEGSALFRPESNGDQCVARLQPTSALAERLLARLDAEVGPPEQVALVMLGGLAYAEHVDASMHPEDLEHWKDLRDRMGEWIERFILAVDPFEEVLP